jgi:sulfate adenylyltransferase subunit 1
MSSAIAEQNLPAPSSTQEKGVLRFITAGSVDDGKSTLIGRLLYDARAIFADQLDSLARAKHKRAALDHEGETIDLALLTDGLEAEREQGITIDVAYRYFATPKRKFIIADTPGHEQYTRNMVTGASTADAAIILIDATRVENGQLLAQTKRHTTLADLLGIRHLVVAVNKMDLVGYDRARFEAIREAYLAFASGLSRHEIHFVPLSALKGDNVVARADSMPWYEGPALLPLLESLELPADDGQGELRFPVQYVLRTDGDKADDFRGYAGRLEAGRVRVGDTVRILPAGGEAVVAAIRVLDELRASAVAGDSVTLVLDRDVDISRGDTLVAADAKVHVARRITADLCWLDTEPFAPQRKYLLRHTTRTVPAKLQSLDSVLDIHTLEHATPSGTLAMNDIGRSRFVLGQPIVCDLFDEHAPTGAFVLIDSATNQTAAAGMIRAVEG